MIEQKYKDLTTIKGELHFVWKFSRRDLFFYMKVQVQLLPLAYLWLVLII